MSDLLTDMVNAYDPPFDADESHTMTLKEKVAHARRLRADGLKLEKEGKSMKSESKEYEPEIMAGLKELDTDSMKFDGKAVSVKEMEDWAFPQEHKREIMQWCIDNDRWEFLDVPTARFKTACKAALEAEMDLPPHAELKKYNKLNGV